MVIAPPTSDGFNIVLVGGLEHGFYDFPYIGNYWECHHPN